MDCAFVHRHQLEGRGGGRAQDLDLGVIQHIDQVDEPARLGQALKGELGNILDNNCFVKEDKEACQQLRVIYVTLKDLLSLIMRRFNTCCSSF